MRKGPRLVTKVGTFVYSLSAANKIILIAALILFNEICAEERDLCKGFELCRRG